MRKTIKTGIWTPLRIVAVYILAGVIWILFSDSALELVTDPGSISRMQTYKGWLYVAVTAGLLYGLIEQMMTRQKEAEAGLFREEQYNRSLFELSPIGLFLCRMDGRIVEANKAFARIIGREIEETLMLNCFDITPEKFSVEEENEIARLKTTGNYGPFEKAFFHKDGRIIPVRLQGVFIEKDNAPFIWFGVEDISERKRVEDELRYNARLLRETGKIAKIGGWEYNTETGKMRWTDEISRIIEIDPTEAITLACLRRFFPEETMGKIEQAVHDAIDAAKPFDFEVELITGAGNRKWVRIISQTAVKDGKTHQIWGSIQDITDSRNAEESLRQSEERYRIVLENIGETYFEVDLAGHFTYVSQYGLDQYGQRTRQSRDLMTQEEAVKITQAFNRVFQRSGGFAVEHALVKITQAFNRVFQTGEPLHRFEYETRFNDGRERFMELSASLMKDRSGNPVGFHGIARDITEEKKAVSEHETLLKQLHQAQKMESVGRLAGGIAHDFNNLLSVVLGYSELILEDIQKEHPHHDALTAIHHAAGRAKDLTRQLLAFSRKQVLEMKILDINDVVAGFEKLLRRVIGEDIDVNMVISPKRLPIRADTAQLEQVLMNLVINARDAMPDGGVLTIKTAYNEADGAGMKFDMTAASGSTAIIVVSDTGSGMDAGTMDKIFEPFFTTKSVEKGTGLGLATSYGIIKQHSGYMEVSSSPGQGSVFKIVLPICDETLELHTGKPCEKELEKGSATILVVEDDPAVRKMSSKILSERGFDVIETDNVEDAVSRAEAFKERIDLLLTDVVMPGMKGPALKEVIMKSHPETKVLFMSGYTDEVIVQHGILQKGVQFIQKPFTVNGLVEKVHQVLKN